jgi:ABC-type transport system substrate-binding protein
VQNHPLRIGIKSFPANLHPVYSTDEVSQMILNKIYHSLFDFDENGKIRESLIENCTIVSKTRIRILIKRGVMFSNGRKLEVKDILATLRLLKDPAYKYPYLTNLKFISEAVLISKYEMMIHLRYPYALWRNHLTFKILNGDEIKDLDPEGLKLKQLSGSNAYTYAKVQAPVYVCLSKNPFYKKDVKYENLKFIVFNYSHLAPLKLINDELDLVEIASLDAGTYRTKPDWQEKFTLEKFSKIGYYLLIFNLSRPEIQLDLRKKLYNCLICSDFVEKFLRGRGRVFKSPFFQLDDKVVKLKMQCSFASTKPLSIITNSESTIRKNFLLFLEQKLKNVGVNVHCEFYEYHTFIKRLKTGNFQIALTGFMLESDLDMKDVFHSKSAFNYAGFKNREMDQLLEIGLQVIDYAERVPIYLQAHKVWYNNLPMIPLFQIYYYMGMSRRVTTQSKFYKTVASESDFLYNVSEW